MQAVHPPSRGDLIAGISVALVLIPQSLAYAEIAGLPAYVGLYAAALPPIAAAVFASSKYLQTGPVAMTALLTFGALSSIADPGSGEYVRLAILLALVVGVTRIGLGLLRAGPVAYLMSQPVLMGFTSAAAILIVASQIPRAVGVEAEGGLLAAAWDVLTRPGDWQWGAVLISMVSAALIVFGRRIHRLFPGVLAAVVFGLIAVALGLDGGPEIGEIPSGFPPFGLDVPWDSTWDLLIPGLVIALVGFAEPAAIARTFATRDRERWEPNREFISQGVANVAAAFSGGFPVGGSFSRTSIAHQSGASSRWAGAIAGGAVLVFLPLAMVLESLPQAVLGAIVVVAVVPLVQVVRLSRLITVTWGQSLVAWVTFLATLILAPRIDLGVVIGIVIAVAVHLRREILIRVVAEFDDETLVLRPTGVLYYGSAPRLSETLTAELAHRKGTEKVVLNLRRLGRVDYTGAIALKDFVDDVRSAGLLVEIHDIPRHARGTLERFWGPTLGGLVAPGTTDMNDSPDDM